MRRTEILQEVRKMRFQEVYETWQEKHWKSIGKVGKVDRFIFYSFLPLTLHSLSRVSLVF